MIIKRFDKNIEVRQQDDLCVKMSYKDARHNYTTIFESNELRDIIHDDIVDFMIISNATNIGIITNKYNYLLKFDVCYPKNHGLMLEYYWLGTNDNYNSADWGDISVISGFEFAAYYMGAPFGYGIDVIEHIMNIHCVGLGKELNKINKNRLTIT